MAFDLASALEWFFLIFTVVSIPIYILVIITLIKFRKELNSPFFTFFISVGVADLWLTIHKWIFTKIPKLFFDPDDKFMKSTLAATLSHIGLWYIYFCQVFGVLLLTVNRFSVLVFPIRGKRIWKERVIVTCLVLQWVLPLPFGILQLLPGFESEFMENLYPVFVDKEIHRAFYLVDMMLEPLILANSFLIMYIIMFIKMYKSTSNRVVPRTADTTSTSRVSKNIAERKAERRLGMTGLILIIPYFVMCATYVCMFFEYIPSWVSNLFYYMSDTFTCSNPYVLLFFCNSVRHHFISVLTCRRVGQLHYVQKEINQQPCVVNAMVGKGVKNGRAKESRSQAPLPGTIRSSKSANTVGQLADYKLD